MLVALVEALAAGLVDERQQIHLGTEAQLLTAGTTGMRELPWEWLSLCTSHRDRDTHTHTHPPSGGTNTKQEHQTFFASSPRHLKEGIID